MTQFLPFIWETIPPTSKYWDLNFNELQNISGVINTTLIRFKAAWWSWSKFYFSVIITKLFFLSLSIVKSLHALIIISSSAISLCETTCLRYQNSFLKTQHFLKNMLLSKDMLPYKLFINPIGFFTENCGLNLKLSPTVLIRIIADFLNVVS